MGRKGSAFQSLCRFAVIVFSAPLIVSCGTTETKGFDKNSIANLAYKLPETKVTVALSLEITGCNSNAVVKPAIDLKNSIVTGRDFILRGERLNSWFKSRDVSVVLNDNRTIKSVNSNATDQTGAIITNVLKTAATVALMAGTKGPPSGIKCQRATIDALEEAENLKTGIEALKVAVREKQQELANAAKAKRDTAALAKQLVSLQSDATLLATKLTELQGTDALQIKLPGQDLPLDVMGGVVSWDEKKNSKLWIPLLSSELGEKFAIGYCFTADERDVCNIQTTKKLLLQKAPSSGSPDCGRDRDCASTLVFRDPKQYYLKIISFGSGFASQSEELISVPVTLAQWGGYRYLGLDVGFGENRTVNLALDGFGNLTTMAWKSDARASNITSAASNIVSSTSDLLTKAGGSDLASQKAEIDQLNTQKSLNQLRACKKILDAGGFSCPAQ